MCCVSDSKLFSFVVTYHVALGCLPLFCSKRRAMAATNFLLLFLFFFLSFFSSKKPDFDGKPELNMIIR